MNKKFIALIYLIVTLSNYCVAQIYPPDDAVIPSAPCTPADGNWVLQECQSDEFNGSFDASIWVTMDRCAMPHSAHEVTPSGQPSQLVGDWGGGTQMRDANVIFSSDPTHSFVRFKAEPINSSTCISGVDYFSAGLCSKTEAYLYGYYEIEAKLPGYTDGSSHQTMQGLWPAFWISHYRTGTCPSPPPPTTVTEWDEIDILEIAYPENRYNSTLNVNYGGSEFRGNVHDEHPCTPTTSLVYPVNHQCTDMVNQWHKYGLEIGPDRCIFYLDGIPIDVRYDDPAFVMRSLFTIIDFQIAGPSIGPSALAPNLRPDDTHAGWPLYMDINYFRYYTLKLDCSNDVLIANNTDLGAFDFGVKKTITFGDGTGSVSLSSTDVKIFRATDSIIIDASQDFVSPLGAELTLIINPCN